MPEEIFILALLGLVAGTATVVLLTTMIFSYLRDKHGIKDKKGKAVVSNETSLTTSELHALMRQAVEEATLPLAEKIDDLERRLDTTRQLSAPTDLLEGLHDEADVEEPVLGRRRVR